jgi:hypothetical protein
MAELAGSLQRPAPEKSPVERPLATQQASPAASLSENASVTADTAPIYANMLTAISLPLDFSGKTAGQPSEQEVEDGTSEQKATEAAQEYRAWAFKLMTAHAKANLQYAHNLMRLTSPFEFVELSANHARKQFELIMSQTAALGELSRLLTTAGTERVTKGLGSVFGERKISGRL